MLAVFAGLAISGVRARVHPGAASLEGDDLIDRSREDLAIVRDHEHGLARTPQLALESQRAKAASTRSL